ncbi:MAG TPA: 2-oxo-hepta-3-ene-1,7-dioic acid hydratase [Paracoccaceae bacterium]|nr:2-oxo-hepta-3-ene-1,7-dioic acid hydratase [Paracoccaceae bacterium]
MLGEAERVAVAEALIEARATAVQTRRLKERHPEATIEDGYAISSLVAERRQAAGARLVGHKIGLTSRAMQQAAGIAEPDFGYLFDDMEVGDGATVEHAAFCQPRIEMELMFVLARPLQGPGVGHLDVLRATEYVVPSIEIIDARFAGQRVIEDNIADNAAGAGFVLGGRPVRPEALDLRWVPGLLCRNAEVEETGVAAGVLGHPALAIAWLANRLGRFGVTLEPGHKLLSGSFVRAIWCSKGEVIRADFGELGSVAVQFA